MGKNDSTGSPGERSRGYGVYLEPELIESQAFQSLNGTAIKVLIRFYQRRVFPNRSQKKRRPGTRQEPRPILNNGKIVFTFAQAEKLGFPRATFMRALDMLVDRGFIDVAETGSGLFRSTTYYAISDRWRKYGTPEFLVQRRSRGARSGFPKGHPAYGNQARTDTGNGNGAVTISSNGPRKTITRSGNTSQG